MPLSASSVSFMTLIGVILLLAQTSTALREDQCEVCIKFLKRFTADLPDDVKTSQPKLEAKFREVCKETKGKDNRLCYYIGGLEESATSIIGEMSKPLSWGMPAEKVCEKLSKRDAQICELRYEKVIDLNNTDLKKLKVRDLKKVLDSWGESCDGCIEKNEFIKRIEDLKPKYMHNEL